MSIHHQKYPVDNAPGLINRMIISSIVEIYTVPFNKNERKT